MVFLVINHFSFKSPREMNKHLKDERDICCGVVSIHCFPTPIHIVAVTLNNVKYFSLCSHKPRTSLRKKQKQRAGLSDVFDDAGQPAKR